MSGDPSETPRAKHGRAPDVFRPGAWVPMREYSESEPVDFVIIGTGAGGGTLACKLAEYGFSVVALDAGPYFRPLEDFASDESEQTKLFWTDDRIVDGFRDADGSSGRIALFHGIMARIGELYRFEDAEDELVPELHETGMQSQSQDGLAQSQSQSDSDAADERETAAAPRFAHAFVGAVRALGLPARYVTGSTLYVEGGMMLVR